MLPLPKCHTCSWENNNFGNYYKKILSICIIYSRSSFINVFFADFLHRILSSELDLDSDEDCFVKKELDKDDNNVTNVDEEDDTEANKADHRISTAFSSSRDSTYSLSSSWSVVSTSSGLSGVESNFSEDTAQQEMNAGHDSQLKPRKKPKKKSRSLIGVERFPQFFKKPLSPNLCRRVQSVGYHGDFSKDQQKSGSQSKSYNSHYRKNHPLNVSTVPLVPLSPKKHICVRRRPILSCDENSLEVVPTIVKVVVFGGDREAGRLARAYCDLQQKESKCPRLTKTCKLQFYFVPTKRRTTRSQGGGHILTEGQMGSSTRVIAAGVKWSGTVTSQPSSHLTC